MPSTSVRTTRRGILALAGSSLLAGCSTFAATAGPADHTDRSATAGQPLTDADWPTFQHDAARTGARSKALPLGDAPTVLGGVYGGRSKPGGRGSTLAPIRAASSLYYTSGSTVVRRDAPGVSSGARPWRASLDRQMNDGASVRKTPAADDARVYVPAVNSLVALNRTDGSVAWHRHVGTPSSASPAIAAGTLYVAGNHVSALSPATGRVRWSRETDQVTQGIAVDGARVYVSLGSSGKGGLLALTSDGKERWTRFDIGHVYAAPAVGPERVYVARRDGGLVALDPETGSTRWTTGTGASPQTPSVADGLVFVTTGDGSVAAAYDAKSGRQQWTVETGLSVTPPAVAGRTVYLGSTGDGLRAVDAATGETRWHRSAPSVESPLLLSDGGIAYVDSSDGGVHVVADG